LPEQPVDIVEVRKAIDGSMFGKSSPTFVVEAVERLWKRFTQNAKTIQEVELVEGCSTESLQMHNKFFTFEREANI